MKRSPGFNWLEVMFPGFAYGGRDPQAVGMYAHLTPADARVVYWLNPHEAARRHPDHDPSYDPGTDFHGPSMRQQRGSFNLPRKRRGRMRGIR